MIGGRQLPPWMVRSNAANQAGISEIKEENKEASSEEVDNKVCKAQKKTQRKQHGTGVSLLENKSQLLKKCEARGRKGKSIKQDEDQGDDIDESGQEKKDEIRAGKRCQQGDAQHLLNKCETRRRKRMSNKQRHDEGDHFNESGMENTVEVPARKRHQHNAPRRKKQKEKDLMDESHHGITESIAHQRNASRKKKQKENDLMEGSHDQTEFIASDDELTVEDLISIAEEYMNAEKEKELQKLQNVGFESEVKPLYTATSKIGSEKDLTTNLENRNSVTDKLLSMNSSVIEPLHRGGRVTNPINTGDPARDMLDLFLGPLLKTSEQVERQADDVTEQLMLDHELSQRSQNDIVVEVAPVWKKKSSLKDRIAMLLD